MHFNSDLWAQVSGDVLIIAVYGSVPFAWGAFGYALKADDSTESPLTFMVFMVAVALTITSHLISAGVIK